MPYLQVYDVTLEEPVDPKQAQMLTKKFAAGFMLVGECIAAEQAVCEAQTWGLFHGLGTLAFGEHKI